MMKGDSFGLRRAAALALVAKHGLQAGQNHKNRPDDFGDPCAQHIQCTQQKREANHFVTRTTTFLFGACGVSMAIFSQQDDC
jgi:hypothetical protein